MIPRSDLFLAMDASYSIEKPSSKVAMSGFVFN